MKLILSTLIILSLVATSTYGELITVYDSNGFERFLPGSIHGRNAGTWHWGVSNSNLSPLYRHWEIKQGPVTDAGKIINVAGTHGNVLSLEGAGQPSLLWLQLGWKGSDSGFRFWGSDQIVVVEYDFLQSCQSGTVQGAVCTYRNAQQVRQTRFLPQLSGAGSLLAELRKDTKVAPFSPSVFLSNYNAGQWHHIKFIQYQPNAEDHAKVRIWLDDTEVTAGHDWYSQWVGWTGWIEAVELEYVLPSSAQYYIDNLSVKWGAEDKPITPVPSHLKWMGFWEYDPASMQGWNNFGFTQELTVIQNGARRGVFQLLDIGQLFFVESWFGPNGSWAGYQIRDDYQQCWKACADLVTPYIQHGQLGGFMMLDEACWNGVTIAELKASSNLIKETFPDCIIYLNEAGGPFIGGRDLLNAPVDYNDMPPGIDWISFDYYGPSASQVRTWYEQDVYPKMFPHQKALQVPAAYGQSTGSWSVDQWNAYMINNADTYYEWAKTDDRIIGIAPWHWCSYGDSGNWNLGTADMPELRNRWQDIGDEICANNFEFPMLPGLIPIQHFDSFTDGEILPSTYAVDPWAGGKVTPLAPLVSSVSFSRSRAFSSPTSIMLKSSTSEFRYCWGTNDRNDARMFAGSPVQYIQFQVWIGDPNAINLTITPYRGWAYPCTILLNRNGVGFKDKSSTAVYYIAPRSNFKANNWNQMAIRIDLGSLSQSNDDKLTLWLNGSQKYSGVLSPISESVFTTISFKGGPTYVDDIGMWGSFGIGEWGYLHGDINEDGYVNFKELLSVMQNWLEENCISLNWCDHTDTDLSGSVNLCDFSVICEYWQQCTNPGDSACSPVWSQGDD